MRTTEFAICVLMFVPRFAVLFLFSPRSLGYSKFAGSLRDIARWGLKCGVVIAFQAHLVEAESLIKPPAIPANHDIVHLSLNGFSGHSFSIVLNLRDATIGGSIVKPIRDRKSNRSAPFRRYLLEPPRTLSAELKAEVQRRILTIRPAKSNLFRTLFRTLFPANDIHVDGDFPKICSASLPFETRTSTCDPKRFSDFAEIEDVFMALQPESQDVYWAGGEYRKLNDQPTTQESGSLLDIFEKSGPHKIILISGGHGIRRLRLAISPGRDPDTLELSGDVNDETPCDWITYRIQPPKKLDTDTVNELRAIFQRTVTTSRSEADCVGGEYERELISNIASGEQRRKAEVRRSDERKQIRESGRAACEDALKTAIAESGNSLEGKISMLGNTRDFHWPKKNWCNILNSAELFGFVEAAFFRLEPTRTSLDRVALTQQNSKR